jgi:Sec-independent protein translocase protein TatA
MTRRVALLCLALLVAVFGCNRAPQVASSNLGLISSLRTALSARNEEWLAHNVAAIEDRHQAGAMLDDEYAAFQRIISQAKSGDWEGAEKAALRLQQAQRPKQDLLDTYPRSSGN